MALVLQRVLDTKHAAPGVTEEVEVLETEGHAHLLDLFAKAIDRPERGIVGLIRVVRPELVVIEELDPVLRQEVFEAFEVLVCEAWSAVQRQDLDLSFADLFAPDLEFASVDRDQADPRGLDFWSAAGRALCLLRSGSAAD